MFFLSPLLIYFPRLLPGIETQPWLTLLLALFGLAAPAARTSRTALSLLTVTLAFVLLFKALVSGDWSASLSGLQLLVGPLFLFGALALDCPPPSRTTLAVIACLVLTLVVVELVAPEVYASLANLLLDRATISDRHRGVSMLTPEPTYAALTLVYLLLLSQWSARVHGARYPWIELIFCIGLVATFSTYAVLLMAALLAIEWPMIFVAAGLVLGSLIVSVIAVGADNDSSVRAIVALARIATVDFNHILISLSVIDPSLGSRLILAVAALHTPLVAPLGLGLTCNSITKAFAALNYDFAFDNPVLGGTADRCLKPSSYAASALLALGWLAVPMFLIGAGLVSRCQKSAAGLRAWLPALIIGLIILCIQGQLTNPIPWLLLFIAYQFNETRLSSARACT